MCRKIWCKLYVIQYERTLICCSYFVHENEYIGISAFINEPAAESERNALMLAVGALVPLHYGRLGRSWKHAEGLKQLARSNT